MASTSTLKDTNNGVEETSEELTEKGELCVVCGDDGAKTHYGVLACLGCKGFFRRALKKANQYECLKDNQCHIDKYERNSCRSCRLQKCLDAGMDPNFVRPDRDFTGKQQGIRMSVHNKQNISRLSAEKVNKCEQGKDNYCLQSRSKDSQGQQIPTTTLLPLSHESWIRKLSVEMRTMLMNLLNIEAKVTRGDTCSDASEIYPLHIATIKEIIDEPVKLRGKRTEMRYEAHRLAKNEELSMIVYRRLIAAIDWVEFLSELMSERLCTDDRIALVKSCFAPLMLFKCSAKTAVVTEKENLLCLCNFAYVPRNIAKAYNDTYHLDNGLVDRLLNELVTPFRRIHLTDEEIVCLSAIIVLNPMAKDLSEKGLQRINQLRDKIYETLYAVIRESRPYSVPSCEFGNLLLYLPIVTGCANAMSENLRFAQTFSNLGIPLLTSLFGCFAVEPFLEGEVMQIGFMIEGATSKGQDISLEAPQKTDNAQAPGTVGVCKPAEVLRKNAETQTQDNSSATNAERGQKRRLPSHFTSPVENESLRDFRLFRPPSSYTLEEMFDDLNEDSNSISNLGRVLGSKQKQQTRQRRPLSCFHKPRKDTPYLFTQRCSPNNWAPPNNWNGSAQQIPLQGHSPLRPARSLHALQPVNTNYSQEFERRKYLEQYALTPRQYYPNLPNSYAQHTSQSANYYMTGSQRNSNQMYANLQQQHPSLGIPLIEKLTFKHHDYA